MVRAVLIAAAILGALLLRPAGTSSQENSAGATIFRGNLARTGVVAGRGLNLDYGLVESWRLEIEDAIVPVPTLVDDVLYFGTNAKYVVAADAQSGVELWRFPTAGDVKTTPAYSAGMLYVGDDTGTLYAVDAGAGTEMWRFSTEGGIRSSPAVANGLVYLGSRGGNFYALNAETGDEYWRFTTSDAIHSSAAVADGVVYFSSEEGNLYAVDAATGTERWRFDSDSDRRNESTPAVADGRVYLTTDRDLIAIDVTSGVELWRLDTVMDVFTSPTVADGLVVMVVRSGMSSRIYAVDAISGSERWSYDTWWPIEEPGTYASGALFFLGTEGIVALSSTTGAELWFEDPNVSFAGPPLIVDGRMFVAVRSNRHGVGFPQDMIAFETAPPSLTEGARVRVVSDDVNLRGAPNDTAVVRTTLSLGAIVTITGEGSDGWWPIETVDGLVGWLPETTLEPV